MATTEILAEVVLKAALQRLADVELRIKEWRHTQIMNVKAEPKVEGPFWRRTVTWLTYEQAEERWGTLRKVYATRQYWDNFHRPKGVDRASDLIRIARAAIQDGERAVVTLSEDEIKFLGLGEAK